MKGLTKKELAPEIQHFRSTQTEVAGTIRPAPESRKGPHLIT
jgi:hypothetical protein